jgi:hypothetical protein
MEWTRSELSAWSETYIPMTSRQATLKRQGELPQHATPVSSQGYAEFVNSLPPVDSTRRRISASAAHDQRAPWISPIDLTSSVGEDDDDHDLSGFVVDDLEDADDQRPMSSVTSSPPPLDTPNKPFYIPPRKSIRLRIRGRGRPARI